MPVYLATLRGTLAPGVLSEIFSHSLGIESSSSQESIVAGAVADAWSTAWPGLNGMSQFFDEGIAYTEATAAKVLDPTIMQLSAAAHAQFTPPLAGTSTMGGMLPSQCALAVSFTAGVRGNGTPLKGRTYLPAPTAGYLDAAGQLGTSFRDLIHQYFKAFVQQLNNGGHFVSVTSRTEEITQPVTVLRVGNKIDTIRRRRNELPELYIEGAIAGPG